MADTDGLRQQIIAALTAAGWGPDLTPCVVADVLPVVTAWVEEQARQRAAQELREAAEACPTTLWYPWFIARADTLAAEG